MLKEMIGFPSQSFPPLTGVKIAFGNDFSILFLIPSALGVSILLELMFI
jgi:hypothetical protein